MQRGKTKDSEPQYLQALEEEVLIKQMKKSHQKTKRPNEVGSRNEGEIFTNKGLIQYEVK